MLRVNLFVLKNTIFRYGFGPPSIVASLLDSPSTTTAHNRLLCEEQHESGAQNSKWTELYSAILAPPKHSYPTPSDSSEGFGRSLMDSRSDPLITRPSTSACYDEPDCDNDKIEAEDLEAISDSSLVSQYHMFRFNGSMNHSKSRRNINICTRTMA